MIAGRYDKFRFEQGATFDVKMTYRNKSTGVPFDFTGYTAAMSFKENVEDAEPPLGKINLFGSMVCSGILGKILHECGVDIQWKGLSLYGVHDFVKNNRDFNIIFEGKLKK